MNQITRHPAFPWVAPFVLFMLLLGIQGYIPLEDRYAQPLRVAILAVAIWAFSRHVISFRIANWPLTIGVGVAVFLIWIGPDMLWPGYRSHWLFQNKIFGEIKVSIAQEALADPIVLVSRFVRAAVLVPILEELFWRGWLMRWLVKDDFTSVPLGTYTPRSFWITAVLFAAEHGPYWEVGLIAGVVYNWLMIRTRSIGDCILAHAITNAILSAFVIATGHWEYWL